MDRGSICLEARLFRSETPALFHSKQGSPPSLPGSNGLQCRQHPERTRVDKWTSPEGTGKTLKISPETDSNVNNQ